MTEHEWLTSTNPSEMYAAVQDRVTQPQINAFLEAAINPAYRSDFEPRSKVESWPLRVRREAFLRFCTENASNLMPMLDRADLLREIIGPLQPIVFRELGRGEYLVRGPDGKDHVTLQPNVQFHALASTQGQTFVLDSMRSPDYSTVLGVPVVVLDPYWLAWKDGTIPATAQAIRDRESFAELPVLADALEEAGCTEAAILDHLRGRELCCRCHGKKYVLREDILGLEPMCRSGPFVPCPDCGNGTFEGSTGYRKTTHVRLCWALNLFIP